MDGQLYSIIVSVVFFINDVLTASTTERGPPPIEGGVADARHAWPAGWRAQSIGYSDDSCDGYPAITRLAYLFHWPAGYTTVPPEACFANFRWDDCGKPPVPVMYYWKPGSRCEVGLWRGCLPNINMFQDEYECVSTCIFTVRAMPEDYHDILNVPDYEGLQTSQAAETSPDAATEASKGAETTAGQKGVETTVAAAGNDTDSNSTAPAGTAAPAE